MKAKDLKTLVNKIPDDAEIVGSGMPGLYMTLVVLDDKNTVIETCAIIHSDDYFDCITSYTDLIFNPEKHNGKGNKNNG